MDLRHSLHEWLGGHDGDGSRPRVTFGRYLSSRPGHPRAKGELSDLLPSQSRVWKLRNRFWRGGDNVRRLEQSRRVISHLVASVLSNLGRLPRGTMSGE